MFNHQSEPENHLKILTGTIWFCSLYDSIDARDRVLSEYMVIAEANKYKNILKWCDVADELFSSISQLLSSFTKGEQVYIQAVRDTLVHGWLHKRNCNEFYIHYVEKNAYIKQRVSKEAYTKITLPYYEKGWAKSIDNFSHRFLDLNLDLWVKLNFLKDNAEIYHKEMYEDIGVVV